MPCTGSQAHTCKALERSEGDQHPYRRREDAHNASGYEGQTGDKVDWLASESIRGRADHQGSEADGEHVDGDRGGDQLCTGIEVKLDGLRSRTGGSILSGMHGREHGSMRHADVYRHA